MIDWLIQRAADPQADGGVPLEGLLSGQEMAVFNALHSAKRRRDWLLGRRTAKQLLQAAIQKSGERYPASSEISILAAADGAPQVWFGENGRLHRADYNISISHSHDVSLCAVITPDTHLLGADIEFIEPRSSRFVEDYFTAEEKELVRQAPAEAKECLITAIWSGKEAAIKAIRQGLRLDTRMVSCSFTVPFEKSYEWSRFSVSWPALQTNTNYPPLAGWWRVWQDFILTLVVTVNSTHALQRE